MTTLQDRFQPQFNRDAYIKQLNLAIEGEVSRDPAMSRRSRIEIAQEVEYWQRKEAEVILGLRSYRRVKPSGYARYKV